MTPRLLLLPLLAALALPLPAQTIRRCTGSDGSTVLTDKPCAAIGARERVPRATARPIPGIGPPAPRIGCFRNLDALRVEIASAIELGDANRLASIYHWPGQNSQSGYAILQRLETLVQRPLLDIEDVGGSPGETRWVMDENGQMQEQVIPPRSSNGFSLLQAGAGGSNIRTRLGLRRHMGCLWISF